MVDATGKLSVIGIFSQLWAATFPSLNPIAFVAAAWRGEPRRSVGIELRMWGPSNDLVLTAQQELELGDDGGGVGIIRLSPLPLPNPGRYVFELVADGASAAHINL